MNDDITAFLPADTDTRRGLTVMEEEFVTYADAKVMLANTTYERAEAAMNAIRAMTAQFDTYISTEIGQDMIAEIAGQMVGVVALAALVIVGVLLFTSRSYFEVVIFLVVFSVAALLCAQLPAALAAGSGDVISISTAKELSALAENCVSDEWSKGKTIVLEADINLTGLDFEPVPLMNGTFDGQGHSIIGLRFDGAGSTQGLFRAVLKDGAVKNFSVSGSLNATWNGEGIGGVAGLNTAAISRCVNTGSVGYLHTGYNVGGITVSGRYVRPVTTVATGGEEPLFLAEGSFREGQELLAVPFTPDCAALGMEADAVLAAYTVKAPGYTGEGTVRMRAPEGGRLYVLSDGAAVSHSFTRDGSYIVFALENGGSVIYAETERTEYLWPAIGGGAAVIAAAGAYLLFRRKKKRPAPAESGEQAE